MRDTDVWHIAWTLYTASQRVIGHPQVCVNRKLMGNLGGTWGWWYKWERETHLVSICPLIRLQRSDSRPTCSPYLHSIMSHLWKGPPTWLFQWVALSNSASMEARTSLFWSSSALMFYTLTTHRKRRSNVTSCQHVFKARGIMAYTKSSTEGLSRFFITVFLI